MAGLRSLHDGSGAAAASPLISGAAAKIATKAASPFDGWERISSVGLKQFRRAKAELLINNLGAACLLVCLYMPQPDRGSAH